MAYIDGFLIPVPEANKDKYFDEARKFWDFLKANGATAVCEAWGDDVPDGEHTSFPMAVKREAGEGIVFSWVEWPDKATRDAAHAKMESDPAFHAMEMPFDGKRMIFGGFAPMFRA